MAREGQSIGQSIHQVARTGVLVAAGLGSQYTDCGIGLPCACLALQSLARENADRREEQRRREGTEPEGQASWLQMAYRLFIGDPHRDIHGNSITDRASQHTCLEVHTKCAALGGIVACSVGFCCGNPCCVQLGATCIGEAILAGSEMEARERGGAHNVLECVITNQPLLQQVAAKQ
jgi:hypothetical protein